MTKYRPIMKTHGGKHYLSKWIIGYFPQDYVNLTYVEPFAGGANTFLQKIPSTTEVLNDIHIETYLIHKILKEQPDDFVGLLQQIEYTEKNFDFYKDSFSAVTDLEISLKEFVLRRMSRGGMKKYFAWSNRWRGGQPGDVNAWNTAIKTLPILAKRFSKVEVFNEDALNIIERFGSADTLHYLDPPYLQSTRTVKTVYDHEFNDAQHEKLLDLIVNCKGKVIISGYNSDLYASKLANWNKIEKVVSNNAGQSVKKELRTEVLWMNY